MQHLRSATLEAGSILRRVRHVEVNWLALRKTAPEVAILGVILFFLLQIPTSKQQPASSPIPPVAAASRPALATPARHLTLAAAVVTATAPKSEPVPPESSHLRVTDRATEAVIAELSRYEIRNLPRAANYGDDEAAFQLGILYELGQTYPQNCNKAAEWVTKSAQSGNPLAEYNLALRYRDGDGVPANPEEATNWFRKAAAHKNSAPDHVLAELPSQPPASVRQ